MKIVLLESLGVPQEQIDGHRARLEAMGHSFEAFEKNADPAVQRERSRGADVIMLANMPLDASVVRESENLKLIDVAFTGVDHIPVQEAREKGIAVCNASGYATQAVAELCVSLMIDLLRHVPETQERCRSQKTKDGLIGRLLSGKTVGIVGAGAIGKRVAALCAAFGCHVIAYSRSRVTDAAIKEQVSLEELLARADIVSLHCPLTEETRGMIGAEQLAAMKPTAFLINTARGALIDEPALIKALQSGQIAGAGLDVQQTEPPAEDSPLYTLENVVLTPHMGWRGLETRRRLVSMVGENIRAFCAGSPINRIV